MNHFFNISFLCSSLYLFSIKIDCQFDCGTAIRHEMALYEKVLFIEYLAFSTDVETTSFYCFYSLSFKMPNEIPIYLGNLKNIPIYLPGNNILQGVVTKM